MKNKFFCINCGKKVSDSRVKRCRKCANTGKLNPGYKHGKCSGVKRCFKCNKTITFGSKNGCCKSCSKQGKLNGRYINGKTLKRKKCLDCGKKLGIWSNYYNNKRCLSCKMKNLYKNKKLNFKGKRNPMYGKISNGKNKINKHHINLNRKNNEESNILLISNSKHIKLHRLAYFYLLKMGKIKEYIDWFKLKYGLR